MNRDRLPSQAFIDPTGENREEIEQLLHQSISLMVEWAAGAGGRVPFQDQSLASHFREIPAKGRSSEELLNDLKNFMDHSSNMAHPGYWAHMDSLPSTVSLIGDLATALLNNNMLSRELSPVFTQLEQQTLHGLSQRFGLPEQAMGLMLGGGSLANLQALAVARNRYVGSFKHGLQGIKRRPVVFASELAHTSIHKAAMLLGLGTEAVVPIPADARGKMDCAQLQLAIERAEVQGDLPFAVVGMAGTTSTGNVDPLEAIAKIAQEHHLWFHVDAAYGGAVVFSEKFRGKLSGIEQADSITFNPQKWLFVTKTSAIVMFRDRSNVEKFFRIPLPYMQDGGDTINRGEISVQGTRHVDILKLWLTLAHFGVDGCAQLVEESLALTDVVSRRIKERKNLSLATEPELNILLFRAVSDRLSEIETDQLNERLQQHLLKARNIYLSLPLHRHRRWLRAVLLNPFSSETQVDELFRGVDEFLASEGIS